MGSGEAAVVIDRLLVWDGKWSMSRYKQYCGSCCLCLCLCPAECGQYFGTKTVLSMSQPLSRRLSAVISHRGTNVNPHTDGAAGISGQPGRPCISIQIPRCIRT
jgi:hypothetical protein